MKGVVLGIDCSTTAAKCVAWDVESGASIGEGRASFELETPSGAAYEQDAEAWWTSTLEAIRGALVNAPGCEVLGVCVAHQRETFVVTDAEGRPRRRAIVWMDERSRAQVKRVRESGRAEAIHGATGKPVCLTPSVYKIMWLREHEPEAFEGDFRLVDVHAFLVRRLTGLWRTSRASADPTGLVDMQTGRWSQEMLELAGLKEENLPELFDPGEVLGTLVDEVALQLGLPGGLPVFAGAGDGQCAGLGAGIVAPGKAYLNLGTAVVSGVWSQRFITDPAFRTLYGAAPGSYFLESDLKGGTFTVNWLVEKWLRPEPGRREEVLEALERDARSVPVGAQGLVLVPYWCGVMNPFWDDDATGAVLGWRGCHGPAHLFRAILEGIAFEERLHTEGVEAASGASIEAFVVVGGGARSDLWCQIIADVTGKRVERAETSEATALGAGMVAALGAGVYDRPEAAAAAMSRTGDVFVPGGDRQTYDRIYDEVYSGLFESVRGAMGRLRALTS